MTTRNTGFLFARNRKYLEVQHDNIEAYLWRPIEVA